jgi:hypothetical protein
LRSSSLALASHEKHPGNPIRLNNDRLARFEDIPKNRPIVGVGSLENGVSGILCLDMWVLKAHSFARVQVRLPPLRMCLARNRLPPQIDLVLVVVLRSRSLDVPTIGAFPASKEIENDDEDDWEDTYIAQNAYGDRKGTSPLAD